jgi:RimJ/RimL family protein N-acetyltransferase
MDVVIAELRAVEPTDLPTFFEHQRDPVALLMAGMPGRDLEAFNEHWARILADDAVRIRTVLVDGQVAGNVLSFERDGRREIGYWIGRDHWGRGVATAALVAFLGEEKARPLHAGVVPENGGSLRVLAKCGFTVCGEEDGLVILRLG